MSISLATVWLMIQKLPAENEFFDAAETLYATPEAKRFETAAENLIAALGGSVTRDPATNRIATINPPTAPQRTQSPQDFNRWQAEHPPS